MLKLGLGCRLTKWPEQEGRLWLSHGSPCCPQLVPVCGQSGTLPAGRLERVGWAGVAGRQCLGLLGNPASAICAGLGGAAAPCPKTPEQGEGRDGVVWCQLELLYHRLLYTEGVARFLSPGGKVEVESHGITFL